jgi:hypothetical protein
VLHALQPYLLRWLAPGEILGNGGATGLANQLSSWRREIVEESTTELALFAIRYATNAQNDAKRRYIISFLLRAKSANLRDSVFLPWEPVDTNSLEVRAINQLIDGETCADIKILETYAEPALVIDSDDAAQQKHISGLRGQSEQ